MKLTSATSLKVLITPFWAVNLPNKRVSY